MRILCLILLLLLTVSAQAAELLSSGKPCAFSPTPNYSLTAKGGTDGADLTDGRLGERPDLALWFESRAVGWSYQPIANVRVDLGQVQPIGEVVIRLLGGSAQAGIDFPGFVKLLVSDDDVTYYQVAEYSKWQPADAAKYALPATEGKSWIHPLRFANLKTRGRYVAFVFGNSRLTCSDELYVYGGDHDPAVVKFTPAQAVDFSVTRPQVAFVKPSLVLTSNLATPQPLGLLDGSGTKRRVTLYLEAPADVEILAGAVGEARIETAPVEKLPGGGTRYALTSPVSGAAIMPWGKLMMQAKLAPGTQTCLRYWLDWGEGKSNPVTVAATVAELTPAPRCKRMTMALGWYSLDSTKAWPDGLKAAAIIGINTLSTFAMWMKPDDKDVWDFAAQTRQQGFKMLNVDSTWHQMFSRHKGEKDFFCQFADGTTGKAMCPSYRGPFYVEELKRVADDCARLKPDYLSTDVELWSWEGPEDAQKCTRCQQDKQKLGIKTWKEWKLAKGYEMWKDLHDAVQAAVKQAGGKPVEMGCYDWRPAKNYQFFWPFDRLYQDKLLNNSQASTYTSLLPYHIELIGNEVREDRSHVPHTEGLPWLTPGDAGVFTAEALRCAMLECFLNGSRGIHFWSNRYWDGECFLGYNQAVRAVAAAEDIIVDGNLYQGAKVDRPARVSGMVCGRDVALLVGEYYGRDPVTVTVTLEVPAASDVIDAETGQKLGQLAAGKQALPVKLNTHRSRVVLIKAR